MFPSCKQMMIRWYLHMLWVKFQFDCFIFRFKQHIVFVQFNGISFLFQIYRHGDANIDKIYPNDPYKDEVHWPGGYGQLTNASDPKTFNCKLIDYFWKIIFQFCRKESGNILTWANIFVDDTVKFSAINIRRTKFTFNQQMLTEL